jgi:hypothetical protein
MDRARCPRRVSIVAHNSRLQPTAPGRRGAAAETGRSEKQKTRRSGIHGRHDGAVLETRPSRSGGPWRIMRPAVWPRSGGRDHEERTSESGDASGVVAEAADLANSGVGSCGDGAVSTTIPELNSEQGALPDRRG